MSLFAKKPFKNIIYLVLFLSLNVKANTSSDPFPNNFNPRPFASPPSDSSNVLNGLNTLYGVSEITPQLNMQVALSNSLTFQNYVFRKALDFASKNQLRPVQVSERRLKGNFVIETTIKFESAIQRSSVHASNHVVARIYRPAVIPPFCEYKFPTSIFLHHILNEVHVIEDVAKVIASGVMNQPSIIVVLHMPHYGERRQGDEEFLNPTWSEFRLNMAQLILDVHFLKNYLENSKLIDPQNFSLTGISLGSVLGLTVGAFENTFSSYGFLVGGGNMANILFNRAKNRPDSEVAKALKGIELNETDIKNEISAIDPMTWMHRYQNKNIMMLSATQDDIVNYELSVKPMTEYFKSTNSFQHHLNNDQHSPTGSAIKKFNEVFKPLAKFVAGRSLKLDEVCPRPQN